MKYLITGANGQLGYDLKILLEKDGNEVLATDVRELDITSRTDVLNYVCEEDPDVIFHCGAWTAVDAAEDDFEACHLVNVYGTENIVEAAKATNAKIIYISTDYVFDGEKDGVYEVDNLTNPLNVYGKTKLFGEKLVSQYERHFIVRISWVFGINGNNFVKTMLKLSETKDMLSVVSDQVGSPTYTHDLACLLEKISLSEKYGTYHATNEGVCNWSDFARYIFATAKKNVVVEDILAKDFPTKAVRPMNSRLSKQSLVEAGFDLLPDWKDAVKRYVEELKKVEEK